MIPSLRSKQARALFPKRGTDSHKGDHGRLLVVGGSLEYHGAPLLTALGALHMGCDLVTLIVPECNFDVTREFRPEFIVRSYKGNHLNVKALPVIRAMLPKQDAVVIGPGLGENPQSAEVVEILLESSLCPMVVDADALKPAFSSLNRSRSPHHGLHSPIVLTPHAGEFEALTHAPLPFIHQLAARTDILKRFAKEHGMTVLLKGPIDLIASSDDQICQNTTGNPLMTTGGTGDVLAGVVGAFLTQGLSSYDAARLAAFCVGTAGDRLAKQQKSLIASALAEQLSRLP